MVLSTKDKGNWAESEAEKYLAGQGLRLLQKNYRSRYGEIDLVMQDKNTIVFIEVRYRKNEYYLSALETVDKRKCERIIRTSEQFLLNLERKDDRACRFDVITVSGGQSDHEIGWFKDAFQA